VFTGRQGGEKSIPGVGSGALQVTPGAVVDCHALE
jgi:hypothetical protein